MFGLNSEAGRLGISTTAKLYEPTKVHVQPLEGSYYTIDAFVPGSKTTFLLLEEHV